MRLPNFLVPYQPHLRKKMKKKIDFGLHSHLWVLKSELTFKHAKEDLKLSRFLFTLLDSRDQFFISFERPFIHLTMYFWTNKIWLSSLFSSFQNTKTYIILFLATKVSMELCSVRKNEIIQEPFAPFWEVILSKMMMFLMIWISRNLTHSTRSPFLNALKSLSIKKVISDWIKE